MTEYALLKDGAFVKFMYRDTLPEVATHKGYSIYPVVREKVNNSTQRYVNKTVTEAIEGSSYVIRTTIEDKPQAELDALYEAQKDEAVLQLDRERDVLKALGATLFDLTNEVRVLKGQQPITAAQFKAYVRGKL